ncbi:MAG: hypothetical protein ACFFDP_00800 [Promethearchaeota archaeon]
MATINCPFCTKTGILLVTMGLATILISAILVMPLLVIVGLILVMGAYIVPSMIGEHGCTDATCSTNSQQHGEE